MSGITIPVIMSDSGLQPQDPTSIWNAIVAYAQTLAPGLTADLPGALIEDVTSTGVGACVYNDSAAVDLVNSLTPYGSNEFLTTQLGNVYGVPAGATANASALVVFSGLPPGFTVNIGWVVTDGTSTYAIQDGGTANSSGTTQALFAVCQQSPGPTSIPANSVNATVTPFPPGVTGVTIDNPAPGTPQSVAQTPAEYQAQVIQAGISTCQGVPSFIKTQLAPGLVPGAQTRLTSVQMSGGNLIVSSGGGDPYQTAGAIYRAVSNPAILAGCTLGISSISNANPAVITTNIAHGYTSGQSIMPSGITGGSGMTALNGNTYTATVTDPYTFTIPVNTTSAGSYTGGGQLSPNFRNISVSVLDYPDTYSIPYVNPLQEATTVGVTWTSTGANVVSNAAVASLVVQPIVDYVNSIPTGQALNLLALNEIFIEAVSSVLTVSQIINLAWVVTVNGISVAPEAGTDIILGDAFSYFYTTTAQVTVAQG